ncbi:MAG: cadherin domain-containing protein [Roseivirga sp.]|jgi:streptogramin lyase|uniref:cadherin domain-containing protein n=1 Tax=Roseivirga sp. TaxID=1964215 RepID=UPI001B209E86|nr:cadherin domain-containing protein [Roseivirga sp.]MBO6661869.1 cadherin domain-containing protein [Roseivirga sp.]MBO6760644.1 cadherin domain-containing protein [Roseivirga sp.]MBO6909542.1 cadherin domain-containing protein [Roseivirga sp.]
MNKRIIRSIAVLSLVVTLACESDDTGPKNSAPNIDNQNFSASEDISDTDLVGKVVATDAEDDALTFEITQNSYNAVSAGQNTVQTKLFEINDKGELSLISGRALDYENKTTHTLAVKVSDGELSNTADITINVVDVDENESPVIADQTFTVAENIPLGSSIGDIVATDPDGDNLTYFFSSGQQSNSALSTFKLENNTLKTISTNSQGELNYEQKNQYIFDVTAGDGQLSTRATITVNITDENDAPTFGKGSSIAISAPEDTGDTEDLETFTATDEDGDALTYSLKNDTDNLFEIKDGGRVELQTGKSLDYETKTSHTFTAVVTDSEGASEELEVTVNVTDVDDTPAATVTVSKLAGSGVGFEDGAGNITKFNYPYGITLQNNGNLFVTDNANRSIRYVYSDGRTVSWSGEQPGSSSGSDIPGSPYGIVTTTNNIDYVSDLTNHVIYKIQARKSGKPVLTIVAGSKLKDGNDDGTGTAAKFNQPRGLAADNSGNIYIADYLNHSIRKMTPGGIVTTIAGSGSAGFADGNGTSASFNSPAFLVVDNNGNIYVTDSGNHRIRKIAPNGDVTTVAGTGSSTSSNGPATSSGVSTPLGIDMDNNGNIYFIDLGSHSIKKLDVANNTISTIAGTGSTGAQNGNGASASFNYPTDLAVTGNGSTIYVTDTGNQSIRKIVIQ